MASKTTTWVLAGLVLVAGVGIIKSLSCSPRLRAGSRLLVVGDSLAVGLGQYFKRMASENSVEYDELAIVGKTTSYFVATGGVAAKVSDFSPTLVLVSLGTNDSRTNYTEAELRAQIAALLEQASFGGAEIVWILPPTLPFADGDRGFSQLVRDTGARVFESASLEISRGPDGIHPTAVGYASWAGLIWQSLTCVSPPESASLSGLGRVGSLRKPPFVARKTQVLRKRRTFKRGVP